jgi:tRNA(Ile)-lysidine synthase TilS/MesJ
MNMFQVARVDSMSIREPFFGGRLSVIRPLAFVDKKTIIQAAKQWGLPIFGNPCPSAGASKRSEYAAWIDERCGQDRTLRRNVYAAVRRFQFAKLDPAADAACLPDLGDEAGGDR